MVCFLDDYIYDDISNIWRDNMNKTLEKCVFKELLENPPHQGDKKLAYILIKDTNGLPCNICAGYDNTCEYYNTDGVTE